MDPEFRRQFNVLMREWQIDMAADLLPSMERLEQAQARLRARFPLHRQDEQHFGLEGNGVDEGRDGLDE